MAVGKTKTDMCAYYLMHSVSPAAAAEFKRLKGREQRDGQALMNTLRILAPLKYDYILQSSVDPFYIDRNIPAALDALEKM